MSSPLLAKFFLTPEEKKSVKKMKSTSEWSVFPLVRHCISEKTVENTGQQSKCTRQWKNSGNAQNTGKTVEMQKTHKTDLSSKVTTPKESCKLN